jgi:hypothetical protein
MPWVVVHSLAQASAALASAGPAGVGLLSACGAAGSLGAGWFLAMVAQAAAAHPAVPHQVALDCAEAPGQALAALRQGARLLILDAAAPAFPAISAACAEAGAVLWGERPPALELPPGLRGPSLLHRLHGAGVTAP